MSVHPLMALHKHRMSLCEYCSHRILLKAKYCTRSTPNKIHLSYKETVFLSNYNFQMEDHCLFPIVHCFVSLILSGIYLGTSHNFSRSSLYTLLSSHPFHLVNHLLPNSLFLYQLPVLTSFTESQAEGSVQMLSSIKCYLLCLVSVAHCL